MVKRGLLVVVLAFLVIPAVSILMPVDTASTLTAQNVDEETSTLFMEAIDLYKRGRDAEALEKLKLVLAKDPSQTEAYVLRDKIVFSLWIELMTKKGEHRAVINEFLKLAAVGERDKRKDDEAVGKLLEQLRTGDYAAKRAAVTKIQRDHGDFAVPTIAKALATSSNDDYRSELLSLVTQMGPEATLALIQCLKSEDAALKNHVIIGLGLIGDDRAAAALKCVVESPDVEEPLMKAAERSLTKLNLSEAAAARSAKELLVEMAGLYYRRAPGIMREFSANRVVWRWEEGQLKYYEVPLYLYHLYVAEECCYDALVVDPNFRPAQIWLARIHLAQAQELAAAAAAGSDDAKALVEKLAKAEFLAASAGVDNLEEAVRLAIAEKDLSTAEAGVFLLGKLLSGKTFQGGALADALVCEHKVIRYAAAIAVGNLVPTAAFANADAVTTELSRCVSESTLRSVLVVDDNLESRNQLLAELRELGYFTIGAADGAEGLLLAKRAPTCDLIIMKTTLADSEKGISTGEVIRELKSDVRTKDIPVIGLTPEARADADKDLFGERLVAVIKIPLVKDAYAVVVKDGFTERSTDQSKALAFAEMAATALAKLAAADKLDPSRALGDLIGALADKPDNVKLPAIVALGAIGDASALAPLKDTFANESNSPEVRMAAAVALGHVCRASGNVPADVFQALLAGLGSDDLQVSAGAGKGLGIAPLTPAQRSDVVTKHRITLDEVFQND